MNSVEMVSVAIGAMIIVLVLWNIRGHRRHGDGTVEQKSDVWLSDNWPG